MILPKISQNILGHDIAQSIPKYPKPWHLVIYISQVAIWNQWNNVLWVDRAKFQFNEGGVWTTLLCDWPCLNEKE
jgi:hypothetical protein